MEWNDAHDIALVSSTFQRWTDAIIGKDRAAVASIHDEDFRVRLGGDWANEAVAKKGFTQGEFSVWRYAGEELKCLAFDIGSFQPGSGSSEQTGGHATPAL